MAPRPWTTATYLEHWAVQRPDHPALRWEGGELTYEELNARTNRVAQALIATGIGHGDRVAVLDRNSTEHTELIFGAAKVNAVPCPVNYRLAPEEVEFVVTDSEAKLFVVGDEFVAGLDGIRGRFPSVEVLTTGPEYQSWRDAHDDTYPDVPQAMDDVCYQLYSSGTTGRPKGVQLTQDNLAAELACYPKILEFDADSVSLAAMPLYHIGGGSWAILGLSLGATVVLIRDAAPERVLDAITRSGVTHAFVVPAVIQGMLNTPGIQDRDFSVLETILYGASPIPETVLSDAIQTFGCSFVQGFGMTETTGTVLYLPAADHVTDGPNTHRLRAVGVPIPDTEAKIVNSSTGEEAGPGEVGEIWVKGPTVMLGYWKMPDETASTITPDGWLRTGDAGYRDEDGYFYVHDRIKDTIISGGENIYPAEVENAIMSHPEVTDAAVIGIPSERWGETPLAVVVRAAGSDLDEAQVIAHCRDRLAGFKCPTSVEWVDELPRNPSGKVLKKDLRAPHWETRDRYVN